MQEHGALTCVEEGSTSYVGIFIVLCAPRTHPKYRRAHRTPRDKGPQNDLARGCHYVYSRTCVTFVHSCWRLLRVVQLRGSRARVEAP